ncbi:hypothetical protein [Curtobacterium luteum]|uniref:hypothetical protein n=1 Tax=Curtobacterium luteum TaxID=33881 RepID=UPI00128F7909|nr:hypothetical protein [Curtobacterium luteum]
MSADWAGVLVAVLAFVLSVPVAIVGLIQAHKANGAAADAQEQIEATKALAVAAQESAAAAQATLELRTAARLVVRAYAQPFSLEQRRTTYHWYIENRGQGWANRVSAYTNFDEGRREYGEFRSLGDIPPRGNILMKPKNPFPSLAELVEAGPGDHLKLPHLTVEWQDEEGKARTEHIRPQNGTGHHPPAGPVDKGTPEAT